MLFMIMLMVMSAITCVTVCVSMTVFMCMLFMVMIMLTCALMGMATAAIVTVLVCMLMLLMGMSACALMAMTTAVCVTVRMLRHMSHRLMIMVLATMAAGAACRMLAIIFYAIDTTINMLVSPYIIRTITDIFEIFLHYIYHLSA